MGLSKLSAQYDLLQIILVPVVFFRIVMFLYRSGSADSYYWSLDPCPALFFSGFQDAKNFKFFSPSFLLIVALNIQVTSY
jgi:hypothetical protein